MIINQPDDLQADADKADLQVEGAARVFVEAELEALLREWHGEDGQRCGENDDREKDDSEKDVVSMMIVRMMIVRKILFLTRRGALYVTLRHKI